MVARQDGHSPGRIPAALTAVTIDTDDELDTFLTRALRREVIR